MTILTEDERFEKGYLSERNETEVVFTAARKFLKEEPGYTPEDALIYATEELNVGYSLSHEGYDDLLTKVVNVIEKGRKSA